MFGVKTVDPLARCPPNAAAEQVDDAIERHRRSLREGLRQVSGDHRPLARPVVFLDFVARTAVGESAAEHVDLVGECRHRGFPHDRGEAGDSNEGTPVGRLEDAGTRPLSVDSADEVDGSAEVDCRGIRNGGGQVRDGLCGGSRDQGLHQTERRCATAAEHQRLVKEVDGGGLPERLSEGSDWVSLAPSACSRSTWPVGEPARVAPPITSGPPGVVVRVRSWSGTGSRAAASTDFSLSGAGPLTRFQAGPAPASGRTRLEARGKSPASDPRRIASRTDPRPRSGLSMDGPWRRGIRASPRSRPSGPDRADPRTARPGWSQSAHSVAQRAQLAGLGRYQSAQQQNPKEGAQPCDRVEVVQEAV